jgi:hypothetical protein
MIECQTLNINFLEYALQLYKGLVGKSRCGTDKLGKSVTGYEVNTAKDFLRFLRIYK